MQIERVDVAVLKTDPSNVRLHAEESIEAISSSLRKWGQQKPIVVDGNGCVVSGNGTLEAARKLGWSQIDIVRTQLTGKDAVAFAIADNRTAELSEWDWHALQVAIAELGEMEIDPDDIGFDAAAMKLVAKRMRSAETPEVSDPAPGPLPEDPTAKLGDVWILGQHRLVCGDALDAVTWASVLDGDRVDLYVTSPPYNQRIDSFKPSGMQAENPAWVERMAGAYSDSMPEEDYQRQQIAALSLMHANGTAACSAFYNHKNRYRDKTVLSPMTWIVQSPWSVRQEIVWDRCGSITLNARMFMPQDERIYWLRSGDEFEFNDSPEVKALGSVWRIPPKVDVPVSAPFPIEIPARCVHACSEVDGIVMDPFLGSGTTLLACEQLGRSCRGIELDPRYVDVAVQRWETLTGERAMDAEGLSFEDRSEIESMRRDGIDVDGLASDFGAPPPGRPVSPTAPPAPPPPTPALAPETPST